MFIQNRGKRDIIVTISEGNMKFSTFHIFVYMYKSFRLFTCSIDL
jgi:hypothetical protein